MSLQLRVIMRYLHLHQRPTAFSRLLRSPPGGKETSAILPKLAGGKSNNNGTFWREQISSHVILIAEFQSRSLASVACQLITTLVSFLAPETFESASKKRPGMPVSSTERK